MTLLGIDGCRSGWCVASSVDASLDVQVFSNFQEVSDYFSKPEFILIDIPIGIGDQKISRDLDEIARKHLAPGRLSSIFIPPVRESLMEENYDRAKLTNYRFTGKKISIQTWNICGKIRDLDYFISLNPAYIKVLKEAHPEICFKYLNHCKLPFYKKRAPQNRGIKERLEILMKFEPQINKAYRDARKQYPISEVANDDIVDALCLLITARLGSENGFSVIEGLNKKDSKGIDMKMYYHKPQKI